VLLLAPRSFLLAAPPGAHLPAAAMGKASARNSNDYRKLQNIIKDLKVIKSELLPDEAERANKEEMATFDDFQRKKHELNSLLDELRTDVDRLTEMRKKLGEDGRDNLTIRLQSENHERLKQSTELFAELKKQQARDEKKGSKKKKLSDKDMADRRHMVELLGEEILRLTRANSRINVPQSDEEVAMQQRVATRKAEAERRMQERREARKKKGRKARGGNDIDEDEFKDIGPKSEQEQAFEAQVQINREEQDKILEEISKGLDELKELASEANKQLVVQGAMLQQVDEQMDSTINNFKVANKRLKQILDDSGGMSRWCPILVCVIFILGLVGYMFGLGK